MGTGGSQTRDVDREAVARVGVHRGTIGRVYTFSLVRVGTLVRSVRSEAFYAAAQIIDVKLFAVLMIKSGTFLVVAAFTCWKGRGLHA